MRILEPRGLLIVSLAITGFLACGREIPEAEPVLRPVRYQRVTEGGSIPSAPSSEWPRPESRPI